MITEVLKLDGGPEDAEKIKHAAALLREGLLVAFPTETVYGLAAAADRPRAVERLVEVKGRRPDKPLTLLVSSAREAEAQAGGFCRPAKKFARLYWPGPLTLVTAKHKAGEQRRFSAFPETHIGRCRTIGLRVPDHPYARALTAEAQCLLATTSANLSGSRDPLDIRDVLADLDGKIELALDGGSAQLGCSSTVAVVIGNKLRVLREGPIPEKELAEAAHPTILFVCTGNTCRSPMAEALCRFLFQPPPSAVGNPLVRRFGTAAAEASFPPASWRICSAGTNADERRKTAPAAQAVLRELGVNTLEHHTVRGLTPGLLDGADWIFTMTRAQRRSIVDLFPEAAPRIRLLSSRGADIEDPNRPGATESDYRRVRDQILGTFRDLPARLQETLGT